MGGARVGVGPWLAGWSCSFPRRGPSCPWCPAGVPSVVQDHLNEGKLMTENRRSYGTGSLYVRTDARGRESWYAKWHLDQKDVRRVIARSANQVAARASRAPRPRQSYAAASRPRHQHPRGHRRSGGGGEAGAGPGSPGAEGLHPRRVRVAPSRAPGAVLRRAPARADHNRGRGGIHRHLPGKGCAPKSIRNYLATLHAICDYAKVRPNPVTDARNPRPRTPTRTYGSHEEEVEALLRGVPDDHLGPTDRACT